LPQRDDCSIVDGMPARRTRESTPDLFAPTKLEVPPSEGSALTRESADGVPVAPQSPHQLLPKDLTGALKHLGDAEMDRLLAAVVDEARRRGRPSRVLKESPVDDPRSGRRAPATHRSKATTGPAGSAPPLTQGRINAVRAAFKAGVKPSTIARQFGLSLSAVRQALASEGRGGKS
jgi:hypothetical protein